MQDGFVIIVSVLAVRFFFFFSLTPQFFCNQQHSEGLVHYTTQLKCNTIQDFKWLKDSILVHNFIVEYDIGNTTAGEIYLFVNTER